MNATRLSAILMAGAVLGCEGNLAQPMAECTDYSVVADDAVVEVGASVRVRAAVTSDCNGALPAELPRDAGAGFQTSELHYALTDDGSGWGVSIPVAFTNRTTRTAYIVNCLGATGLVMERWTGDEWQPVWSPLIPACLSEPLVIEAGATLDLAVNVYGAYPGTNHYPRFDTGRPAGVFRLVWRDVVAGYDRNAPGFGEKLPITLRRSNRFELR